MPRVSDEQLKNWTCALRKIDHDMAKIAWDLQDARAALKAIANWKTRTTDEPPLSYIERIAKEVVG